MIENDNSEIIDRVDQIFQNYYQSDGKVFLNANPEYDSNDPNAKLIYNFDNLNSMQSNLAKLKRISSEDTIMNESELMFISNTLEEFTICIINYLRGIIE